MPVRKTAISETTLSQYQNHSYEYMLLSWLLQGGWEASKPSVDLGSKTDVQITDGKTLYRIQVKCLDTTDEILQWKINGKEQILIMWFIFPKGQIGVIFCLLLKSVQSN